MNVQLYEPDMETVLESDGDVCNSVFMRPSPFGSYVKLEDYEALERRYEALLDDEQGGSLFSNDFGE